jgi:23S rRNA pseudouridine2605 synthase
MLRLQKLLADAGIASRRKAEELIVQGRVTVDGVVITRLGEKADPSNDIRVDGEQIKPQPKAYILLNKPTGVLTTAWDPQDRPKVMDLLGDVKEAVRPVGRLDVDTEGLLLLTNDGELAYRLTHARYGVPKVYHAEIQHPLKKVELRKLREGIELDEGVTAPAHAGMLERTVGRPVVEIVIFTGWYRQVRRMLEAIGHPVIRLKRVAIGPIGLGTLPLGKWRRLNPAETATLRAAVAFAQPVPAARPAATTQPTGSRKPAASQSPSKTSRSPQEKRPARKPQTAAPAPRRTGRVTLPARKQDAQTRMRRGTPLSRARTR